MTQQPAPAPLGQQDADAPNGPSGTTKGFIAGPYTRVGDTICGARQPRRDIDGNVMPGAFTEPAIADMRPIANAAEREATAELLRAAPEVLAQRDDLAQRLSDAINYIEHGIGERAGVADAAALRRLLDREVLTGLPLKAAIGQGLSHSEASFDIVGAKTAVAIAKRDPLASHMPSYAALLDMVSRLANKLDDAIETHIYDSPRDAIGSPEEILVKQAFALIHAHYIAREAESPRP